MMIMICKKNCNIDMTHPRMVSNCNQLVGDHTDCLQHLEIDPSTNIGYTCLGTQGVQDSCYKTTVFRNNTMCKAQQQVACRGTRLPASYCNQLILHSGESCDHHYERDNGISKQCIDAPVYPQFDCQAHQQQCDDPQ